MRNYSKVGSKHFIKKKIDDLTLQLDDGSVWKISKPDGTTSRNWVRLDDVVIWESTNPSYPYELTKAENGESVEANFIGQILT